MKIISFRKILGPNVYHYKPVFIMRIDLEDLVDTETKSIAGFNERLLKSLPGLYEHTCSTEKKGGFVERLHEGTYFAHLLEHMALELSHLVGIDVNYGKARFAGVPGQYDIITRFKNAPTMQACCEQSIQIVMDLLNNKEVDLASILEKIKKVENEALGPSGQCIYDAAKRRDIPVKRIGDGSLLQLGWGKKIRRVQAAVTDKTNLIASDLVQDKEVTKKFLRQSLIPVPDGVLIHSEEELESAITQIHPPYVLKPVDGHHGEGVILNLQNLEELKEAFKNICHLSNAFLLEEMCSGNDYRILIIDGKFIAAAERRAPEVKGDGVSTITQLIAELNIDPLRKPGHSGFLTTIVVDEIMIQHLNKNSVNLETVLEKDRVVTLRGNANLSSGGTATDVTKQVPDETKALCERIARLIGLDICGIDVISADLTKPLDESFKVIEVNAGPGLRMHLGHAEKGERTVGDEIVEMLMPKGEHGRIPIIGVTGTNGKTTVVRLLNKIMSRDSELTVGMTSTDGVFVGNKQIAEGDSSGPQSAEMILMDPAVECAVLEIARGGLLRGGLPYDWSDAAVITNIRADHLGQDGIRTIDDLIWIKSLVAERVKEGGVLVLNADDMNSVSLINNERVQRLDRKIVLYSTREYNSILSAHLSMGHDAFWCENEEFLGVVNGHRLSLGHCLDYPLTRVSGASFQISNILAAMATAISLGESPVHVMEALRNFNPTAENQGRFNIYRIHDAHVIIDYGHNADAISNIGEILYKHPDAHKIAMFGLPGDRSDDLLTLTAHQMGKVFDEVYMRDDEDLRGRQPLEVPQFLENIFNVSFPNLKHHVVHDYKTELHGILSNLKKGDIFVIFFENLKPLLQILREFDPKPVDKIEGQTVVYKPQSSDELSLR